MVKAENWRFWQLILKLDGEGGELKILAIDTETGCHQFCRITHQSFLLFPAHSAHSEGESSRYCWWIDNISYVSTNAMRLVPINPTTSRVSSHTILLPLLILDWLLRVPLSGIRMLYLLNSEMLLSDQLRIRRLPAFLGGTSGFRSDASA
jgi:hypothetical protein